MSKTGGRRPGMVIYTTYRTVNVTPAEDLVNVCKTENNKKSTVRCFFVEWLRP